MKPTFAKTTKALARPVLAASLAAAFAFSPVAAAPARAEDSSGAIAAAGFLGLLMAGVLAASQAKGGVTFGTPDNDGWDRGWHPRSGPDYPRRDPRKALPERCEFTVHHGRDRGTFYDHRCLVENFRGWPYLPDRCEERVDDRGHFPRRAYDAQCLARFGYYEAEWGRYGRR